MYFSTIILIACISQFSDAKKPDLGQIIFSNILFRHGDRTPAITYPNDPYNMTVSEFPAGELTNLGKRQHLELGKWFRKRYSRLLPEFYSPEHIYVRSTNVDRTLMSAQVNLAGLYPPRGYQVWSNVSWLPIPVHTMPHEMDNLVRAEKFCARHEYEVQQVMKLPEIAQVAERNKELFDYLTKHSGLEVKGLREIVILYDALFIEELYNFTLPEWTKSVYPDKMKPLVGMFYTIPTYNDILRRLKSGMLLGEMARHFVEKAEGKLTPDRRIWMYSGHDTTVANLLMTLNLFEAHMPPYTASVLLELRVTSKGKHVVTVWYKNSTEPVLMTLPGCKAACPLEDFLRLTAHIRTDAKSWEEECSLLVTDPVPMSNGSIISKEGKKSEECSLPLPLTASGVSKTTIMETLMMVSLAVVLVRVFPWEN